MGWGRMQKTSGSSKVSLEENFPESKVSSLKLDLMVVLEKTFCHILKEMRQWCPQPQDSFMDILVSM